MSNYLLRYATYNMHDLINDLNLIPEYPQMQDKNQQRVVNSILL